MSDRIVLAYSGGLDTSVCIGWLTEETGQEVVAVALDIGQGEEDMEAIRQRALDCGAVEAVVVDARDEFAEDFCRPALRANALYMDRYPLVSALSRPLIVRHLAEAARSTAQRWSPMAAPEKAMIKCVSRSASRTSRRAKGHRSCSRLCLDPREGHCLRRGRGLPIKRASPLRTRSTRTSGGARWRPASWRTSGTRPLKTSTPTPLTRPRRGEADEVVITFESGNPIAIDGEKVSMLQAIQTLNARAGAHGVGRLDMVEDRLVGIKSREVYEAPGAIALITAHMELENVTVERELARFKRGVDQRWGELVYDGQWYSPLKRALDTFIDEAQQLGDR